MSEEDTRLKEEVDFHTEWLKEKELTEKIPFPLLAYHQINECRRAFNTANPLLIETSVLTLLNMVPPEYLEAYPEIKEQIDDASYIEAVVIKVKTKGIIRMSEEERVVEVERIDFRQVFMALMNLFYKLKLFPQFVRKEVV